MRRSLATGDRRYIGQETGTPAGNLEGAGAWEGERARTRSRPSVLREADRSLESDREVGLLPSSVLGRVVQRIKTEMGNAAV